ncbi:MAG: DNA-processing protein DprA [Bradymonadaceae bacterium]
MRTRRTGATWDVVAFESEGGAGMEEDEEAGERACSGAHGPVEGAMRAALWCLWSVRGVKHGALRELRGRVDPEELWDVSGEEVAEALEPCGLGPETLRRAVSTIREQDGPVAPFRREQADLPDGAELLHVDDPSYPSRLFELGRPPSFLYVRGRRDALDLPSTASVVGSRRIDVKDARRGADLVGALAEAGVGIVSGGALGADAVAHRACLEQGVPTVVVLPSGLDEPTPASNADLFERAAREGVLVTEYPLGVEVRKYHFPRRNRLIAALGDATVVLRGGKESGTMLTAEAAEDIDRPVCALLGGLDEKLAAGCNELIVEGAQAVRHAGDVLEYALPTRPRSRNESMSEPEPAGSTDGREEDPDGGTAAAAARPSRPEALSDEASDLVDRVAAMLDEEPTRTLHVDAIAREVEVTAEQLQSLLLELELHGVATKKPGANAYEFPPAR